MNNSVAAWTAFVAGVVSFLSPCVLPLVPGYISILSGLSLEELSRGTDRKNLAIKAGLGSVFFVLGFSLVFVLLGASASAVGVFLSRHLAVMSKLAGILIIFFGLHTIGILPIPWLYREKRFDSGKIAPGLFGAFVMGLAFAFGWTPCIGPVLAGILAVAATRETLWQGMALLLIYSLGLGIPFILTGFGVNAFLQFFKRYKRYIRWGEIVSGIILIFIGLLIFTNRLTFLISYMPNWLYRLSI